MNPFEVSFIFQFAIFLFVFLFYKRKFQDKLYLMFVISLLLPVPIFTFLRPVYLIDLFGAYYLFRSIFIKSFKLKLFPRSIFYSTIILLVGLPFIATINAYFNNNTINISDAIFHIVRACIVVSVFKYSVFKNFNNKICIQESFHVLLTVWLLLLFVGVLEWLNIVSTDIVKRNISYNSYGYIFGFMGLDKPQIALFSVAILNVVLYIKLSLRFEVVIKFLIVFLTLLIIVNIGSRQGLIFSVFSFLVYLFNSSTFRNFWVRIITGLGVLFVIIFMFLQHVGIKNERFITIIDFFSGKSNLLALAESRDPFFMESVNYVIGNRWMLFVGNGLGTEESGYYVDENGLLRKDDNKVRTYFEGEIFRILWVTGIIGFLLYIILIFRFIKYGINKEKTTERIDLKNMAKLLISISLIFLVYSTGQFFLFTLNAHNALFAYFTWWLYGGLMGTLHSCKQLL
ncbi:MAG: hypothetical protein JXB49_00315 [Bacteroidales bacterium]|nr:hypothetical protein [Bacteroidales bacterium]